MSKKQQAAPASTVDRGVFETIATTSQPTATKHTSPSRKDSHNTERLKWEDHVIVDHGLSSVAYRVGSFIASHLNEKTRTAWPSSSSIEEKLGLSRTVVFDAIRELKDRGHLALGKRKVKGGGNYNEYWLTLGDVSKAKRSPRKGGSERAKPSPADRSPLQCFLIEYPLRGVADYEPAVQAELDRAIADGHTLEVLVAAAEKYRRLCSRTGVIGRAILPPEAFLSDRWWETGEVASVGTTDEIDGRCIKRRLAS